MSDEFLKHIDTITGNAPAAPKAPPLPPKKAPPAPPKQFEPGDLDYVKEDPAQVAYYAEKTAADRLRAIAAQLPAFTPGFDDKPVMEQGFVNPPDSGAVLAATPEEAAAAQGIVAPQPSQFDTMTLAELRAQCVARGIDAGKLREAGLKKKLNDFDAANPVLASVAETAVALENAGLIESSVDFVAADTLDRAIAQEKFVPAAPQFTLYVNCYPLGRETMSQSTLVAEASKHVELVGGYPDYRQISYGAGAPLLCEGARLFLAVEHPSAITIDTRTPEGSVLLTTLEGLAGLVVRGV